MNIVLVADESAGVQMLRALAESHRSPIAVLAEQPRAGAVTNVWNVARNLGIETFPAEMVKSPELAEWLRANNADILLNVHSLHIMHPQVLAAPRLGAFNLHPGPLPRYAGLNVVSWAIFRGESNYGVTVHRMEPALDTGSIIYQSFFPIEPDDTALSLSFKCSRAGIDLMLRLVQDAESGSAGISGQPQDLLQRQYFGHEVPDGGQLSWNWPAQKVIDFVRACDYFPFDSPWGHPRTKLGAQEFTLVKAARTGRPCDASPGTVGESTASGVLVACRDEWVLANKLHIDDKYLPAASLLRPGDVLHN